MKTFKQLREKWIHSIGTNWSKDRFDIFKNPSRKEIAEIDRNSKGLGGFRAWLLSNGDMYAWQGILHSRVYEDMTVGDKIRKDSIPIQGFPQGSKVTIGIALSVINTDWRKTPLEEVAEMVRQHKQMKRLFSKIDVQTGKTMA